MPTVEIAFTIAEETGLRGHGTSITPADCYPGGMRSTGESP